MKFDVPEPPEHLQGRAREWWVQMVESYEGFEEEPNGIELLTAAAVQLMRAEAAREVIDQRGIIFTNRFGAPVEHPACVTERSAMNLHRLLVRELGLQHGVDESTRVVPVRQR